MISTNPMPTRTPMPNHNTHQIVTDDEDIVAQLRTIMARADLTYVSAAAALGASPTTVRLALLTGRAPRQKEARAKFRSFVERNATVQVRSEVRFV